MIIFWGIMLPFLGTSIGAAFVFFMKGKLNPIVNKALLGAASGIMVAASVWSLLIPSMEMSAHLLRFAFFPAVVGFLSGVLFLLLLDRIIFRLEGKKEEMQDNDKEDKEISKEAEHRKLFLLVLAIILHNIPEGMAVGAAFAGSLSSHTILAGALAGALALSLGIAIQNIPEGAIVSMPLRGQGMKRRRSFFYGVLSGVVEPIGAGFTLLLVGRIRQILPFLLSFAAGCMIYVVVQELIPEAVEKEPSAEKKSVTGILSFSAGFLLMMILDVAL